VEAAKRAGKDVLVWIVADDHAWLNKKESDLLNASTSSLTELTTPDVATGLIIAQPVTGSAADTPAARELLQFLFLTRFAPTTTGAAALVDDSSFYGVSDQQEYDEQREEQPGESNGERRASDACEAKERGHEAYHKERKRELQHVSSQCMDPALPDQLTATPLRALAEPILSFRSAAINAKSVPVCVTWRLAISGMRELQW